MTEHTLFRCPSTCALMYCAFCQGGLALCTLCGGAEGTLTTECCGRRLTAAEEEAIHESGTLDFKGGRWVGSVPVDAGTQPQAAPNACLSPGQVKLSTGSVGNQRKGDVL